jgi:hypothetical protein
MKSRESRQQLLMVLLQSWLPQACWQQHQQPWPPHKQSLQGSQARMAAPASSTTRQGTCLPTSWTPYGVLGLVRLLSMQQVGLLRQPWPQHTVHGVPLGLPAASCRAQQHLLLPTGWLTA